MNLNDTGYQTECRRCGTCCAKGGPALHKDDLPLLADGKIAKEHLYTLRRGEIARHIDDRLMPLEHEIIKVKGRNDGTWACMFYDSRQRACTIYSDRPVECQALRCWDLTDFNRVMARRYIQRRDLIENGGDIEKLVEVHEERCAYGALQEAIRALRGPMADTAADRVLDILRYDHTLRSIVPERLNLDRNMLDFFFGRPLSATIRTFGLEVQRKKNGFVLVPLEPQEPPE
jgi:Fe-S-cluster containining protein